MCFFSFDESVTNQNQKIESLISTTVRARPFLNRVKAPMQIQKRSHSEHEGPPQPFDNMPFSIPNRFVATVFFAIFFGIGLWSPSVLIWYMMAKRTF
ncbi:unnamed protein product [Arctia plantaginis]|uniref:Cytochrome c oxidase polypeptide VIIc n=1 Tax=Arctia plantaginis TaxID=874455 RepID=A0A8S1BHX5_ARCPL|nr:unnamed protein product [Arctia plantaginis]